MFLILLCVTSILLYCYMTKNHNYWKKKGIEHEKPIIFFGNSLQQITGKISASERFAEIYYKYPNEKYVGIYSMRTPVLVLRDPELIKHVLVLDFKHFNYRGIISKDHRYEPLIKNIFHQDGDIWKVMRQKMTPAFSSGKVKAMFPLIVDRAERLLKLADNLTKNNEEVDMRELMARYTTDIIGACGFGLDTNSINDEASDFRRIGKRIFTATKRDVIIRMLKYAIPEVTQYLHFFSHKLESDFLNLTKQIMSKRENSSLENNDFIDSMLEIKRRGKIKAESIERTNPDGSPAIIELVPKDELLAAQVFVFFAAGFETSSSASSFLLHMLAFHPEEQERCQQEVDEIITKYNGKLCYEAVKDMKYLEMALRESLRILPPLGFLNRQCVKKYTFPGTSLTIDEGTVIVVPVQALQMDEKYFDNPKEFKPSRFHPHNSDNLMKFAYLPFSEGPRNCIGERLGLMQSLIGVAAILSKFSVAPSINSILFPHIQPTSFIVQVIKGGLPLLLKPRSTQTL